MRFPRVALFLVPLLLAASPPGSAAEGTKNGARSLRRRPSSIAINATPRRKTTTVSSVTYPPESPRSDPLPNPERGFYWQETYRSSSPTRLDGTAVAAKRADAGMTVMLRLYYLDSHLHDDEIAPSVLEDIKADFDALRASGVKAVLRFAYTDAVGSDPTEPTKDRALSHIGQLAPILTANQNAILSVQAGFVGPWGEWHGSTHFSDDADGRREVLDALLDAVPDRVVQVRTPLHKRMMFPNENLSGETGGFVSDGSFETPGTPSWWTYGSGYEAVTEEARTGGKSVKVTNGGAGQSVVVVANAGNTVVVSGYSKAVGVSTALGSDYSVYADVGLSDGSYLWGQNALFEGGTSDGWQYAQKAFRVPDGKSVTSISMYAMYRNDNGGGVAYFDDLDVKVYESDMTPLSNETAHSGSEIARTGHHNDCFLASANDYGTYVDSAGTEYPYLSDETKYTAMGGETCALNPPRSECAKAQEEMELFHYTYLNSGYNQDVLSSWEGVCMEEVKARLGYRLVLKDGQYPDSVPPGGTFSYNISFDNVGYAAPVNGRRVQLVMRNAVTGEMCAATDDKADARTWYGGGESYTLAGNAVLPPNVAEGDYNLFLHVTDPDPVLRTSPEYKTAFANGGDVNEAGTGLVGLGHTIAVSQGAASTVDPGASSFAVMCGSQVKEDILPPAPSPTGPPVTNGGFEGTDVGSTWQQYMGGYEVIDWEKFEGTQSVKVEGDGGAKQEVVVSIPAGSTITVSGYSKATGVATTLWNDYSVYSDVYYKDGTALWGQCARFQGGTHDWEYSGLTFVAQKDIIKINLYAMYRGDAGDGVAYFDNLAVSAEPPILENGFFEGPDVGTAWSQYDGGYTVTTSEKRRGEQSIAVRGDGGAKQKIINLIPAGSTISISGYSKAVGVATALWNDYSVYSDVSYEDGTMLWGQCARFQGGTHDWQYASHTFVAQMDVVEINVYAMYRGDTGAGVAYFDDLDVRVDLPTLENRVFEGPNVEAAWSQYGGGYTIATSEKHGGSQSVMVNGDGGAKQEVTDLIPAGSTVTISGYSKAVSVATTLWNYYSIYSDVYYQDGETLWGQCARFQGGTHDWQYAEYAFVAQKEIAKMNVYAMYNNDSGGGVAYFDDVRVRVDPPVP